MRYWMYRTNFGTIKYPKRKKASFDTYRVQRIVTGFPLHVVWNKDLMHTFYLYILRNWVMLQLGDDPEYKFFAAGDVLKDVYDNLSPKRKKLVIWKDFIYYYTAYSTLRPVSKVQLAMAGFIRQMQNIFTTFISGDWLDVVILMRELAQDVYDYYYKK